MNSCTLWREMAQRSETPSTNNRRWNMLNHLSSTAPKSQRKYLD